MSPGMSVFPSRRKRRGSPLRPLAARGLDLRDAIAFDRDVHSVPRRRSRAVDDANVLDEKPPLGRAHLELVAYRDLPHFSGCDVDLRETLRPEKDDLLSVAGVARKVHDLAGDLLEPTGYLSVGSHGQSPEAAVHREREGLSVRPPDRPVSVTDADAPVGLRECAGTRPSSCRRSRIRL